jgi:hypothetical protein
MSNVLSLLAAWFLIFVGILGANISSDFLKHKLQKTKSFTVYYTIKGMDASKLRLYFNGVHFQSVLASDYTEEELKGFAVERINVNVAKQIFNISSHSSTIQTKHGEETTVKAIMITDKNGATYIPFFRTKEDWEAFFKEIF